MEEQTKAVALADVLADTGAMDALRERGPIHRVLMPTGTPAWLVVGHEEAVAALSDTRLSVAAMMEAGVLDGGKLTTDQRNALLKGLTNVDPPDHRRLRRLVSGVFTARRIEAMRPWISQLTDELIAAFADKGRVELMAEFATPLPVLVICELLGIPEASRDRFRAWSRAVLSGLGTPDFPVDAAVEFTAYLRGLIAEKRECPDDGLLSAMIQARDEGDALSEDELTAMATVMIIAGHDTTLSLIGNGIYLLMIEPDRAEKLRADPGLIPAAIEEFLRLESPVPVANIRAALSPVDIGGAHVEPGELVIIGLQAANRDKAEFAAPDRFDMARAPGHQLAFGYGIHYCLGAPLARLEGELAIGTLLRRFPDLRLAVPAAELTWSRALFVHRLNELPLAFG
ncbi:MAG TPA: cytochrome P450 [Actinocrinis sp.]|jgi:cytochrome P450|uniref:cytochrome P450 family protein n=1 Tax=Actinocrinis sp. TaxID=1920516 RepID=UPI002DDD5312|nr:cytochrome P450 [Actinocrinis sp.]HEV3170966.1 cytochrome P450 [Actinocrinis sp.]